ncbi:MAG: hypothetical protein IPO19_12610 [Rhodoferax sp.]|nr:hypothetical protein [Rhodoferax sp.]
MKDHHFGRYEERRWRPIVWTSELEVGVETIDKAHRELIELYNAVREASQLKDRAWTGVLLERLGNATAAHFEEEEMLMSGINYAQAPDHRRSTASCLMSSRIRLTSGVIDTTLPSCCAGFCTLGYMRMLPQWIPTWRA